jgi:hypothetical protein
VRPGAALLGSAAAFVLLALPFLAQPIDSWEWLNRCAGERIVAWGLPAVDYLLEADGPARPTTPTLLLIHPPSSAYLIALSLRLLGDGDWQARVPGVLSVLATAAVLATLVRRHGGPAAGWVPALAVALYLVHPATLQGALYLGFSEGTLLPLTWALFLLAWFETVGRPWAVRVAALGLGLALALWAKITTSLALPVAAALVALFTEGLGPALAVGAGASLLGFTLFLGTWWLYLAHLAALTGLATGALWMAPFDYLASEAQVFSLAGLALNAVRCLLYLGPFLIVAAVVAIVRRVVLDVRRRRAVPGDIVPLLVVGVSVVYLVVPGGTGSFPKYHLVILPLLAWLAAEELARDWAPRPGLTIALLALGVAYYGLLVGDPLLLLNHDLRAAQLSGGASRVLGRLGWAAALSLLFPLALLALLRRWRPALVIAIATSHLALALVQAQAGYFTKHMYGTPADDFTGTVALLRSATPPAAEIVALPEFGYASRRPIIRGILRRHWSDPDALAALVRDRAPAAVVYGLPTHTVEQVRGLEQHPGLRASLGGGYKRHDVGEFTVWVLAP